MDYKKQLTVVDQLPPFEVFVKPYCDKLLKQIDKEQNNISIKMKSAGVSAHSWFNYSGGYQSLSTSKGSSSMPASKRENYHEIKSLLNDFNEDYSSDDDSDNDDLDVMDNQLHGDTDDHVEDITNEQIRSKHTTENNNNKSTVVEEEVYWKVHCSPHKVSINSSKLVFFKSQLLSILFGLNETLHCYYIKILPGERLKSDLQVCCQFRIHHPVNQNVVYQKDAEREFNFTKNTITTYGFDQFISRQDASSYLDSSGHLLLSVLLVSEMV